jgi:hypothetical protein
MLKVEFFLLIKLAFGEIFSVIYPKNKLMTYERPY